MARNGHMPNVCHIVIGTTNNEEVHNKSLLGMYKL